MLPAEDSPLDLAVRALGLAYVAAVAAQLTRPSAGDASPVAALVAVLLLATPGVVLVVRPAVGRWVGRTAWGLVQLFV